ncbi:uncharacterized protein F5891DRAFT_992810 [Suillus fuscotomentosus]|uniref:Uncharacterized protein n=1 Tax=Suillus fuscotomentosus TaxID=1912939 RepID=A0AAD4ELN9_9AGAM|nr:uncharacterized protein F5891DRAFT_992810 [Suillus fuscotomentosus]KAG1908387.1 hypothetical protein F5891DRAFT_992810 [Suillus fuscotomentosus]
MNYTKNRFCFQAIQTIPDGGNLTTGIAEAARSELSDACLVVSKALMAVGMRMLTDKVFPQKAGVARPSSNFVCTVVCRLRTHLRKTRNQECNCYPICIMRSASPTVLLLNSRLELMVAIVNAAK